MREETSQIPGVVSAPLQNAPQGSGMVYTVPGNSTAYGWKLAPGSSGILWTDSNYSVLPEAVIIEFDDVAIELGADGETRTRFHGETTYSAPESVAVDFKEVVVEGFDQDSVGDTVELENQLIPNQLDEMGAEISFDIGSFLTENMMDADCSLELHGMPSGLVYNPARMRVEGTISDDAPTGHPHHVTIIINVGNGKSIKSGFSWTVRDVKAVDQNSVNTMVVPSLNNNDDASSAAVLFSVAASMSLASRGFSLAKSGNDLGGDGKPQAANGNGLLQFSPLAGAGGESVLTGGEDDDLINLNAASGVPISREDDDENSLPSEFTAPTAQLSRGGDDESPQQNAQPSLSKDDVRGAEEVNAAAENGSQNQNTAPYAAPPPATTALEETLRTDIDVLSYAFDLDQDILRVVEASAQHGSVTVTAEGKLNYQPDNLFNGIDIISYTLDDGNGGRSSTSFEIDVLPLNDAPVVGNIIPQNTTEDVAIGSINVLSSAIDVDGDTLSVQAGSVNALHGSVNINGDGTLNYTPNSDYFGSDTISYTIDDGSGGSNATASGFVNVTVTAVNDAPTAGTPNAEMMNEDGLLANINVLNFAADIDGDLVSITPGSASSLNGNVTVNGDGTLNYIPNANFNGLDTISYTVEDGNGGSSVGSVTVNIGAVNDVPITNTVGPFTTNEDNVLNSIDVLSAASDIDGDALSVANGSVSALNGAVTINADNTLNYTPNSDYFGSDTISYTIEDGHGGNVAATIDVTVNSVNDIPLSGTPNTQTTDEDTALTSIDVLSFSSDLDGDVVSVISGSVSAANGSVAINGDGTLNYTPNANFNGSDTISYSVEDGNGGTAVGSVAVNVNTINDAPLAGSVGAQATTENTALNNILVLPSASDVDGDTLSIVAGSGSALNGVVSINGDGTLNYTPNINFNGSDTVSYSVTDGNGGVVVGTVDIAVASVNNTPIAGLPSAQTTNEDVALNNINVLSAASDIDGDTLTVQAGSASALNGAVSINGDGTLNYTPNADYFGSDTISYTVDDGNGGTAAGSISVTVNSVNDAPTALAGLGGGSDEDNGHAYSVVGFGSDIDGTIDPATVQLVGTANAGDSLAEAGVGVWTVNSTTGAITFTPEPDYDGPVAPVGYFFRDDQGLQSNNGTVTHNINPINDAPVAGSPAAQTTNEDVVLNNINVLSAASDVDGDTLTVQAGSVSALNGSVTINGDGTLNYTPNAGYSGSDTISYTVDDGNGGTVGGTVAMTVSAAANNAPVTGSPTAQTTNEDVAVNNIDVLSAASDIDGDTLIVQAGSASALNGAVSINGDGTLNYTPNADYFGSDTISYTVDDGNGGTAAGSVAVTVNSVNDAPVASTTTTPSAQEDTPALIGLTASDVDGTIDPTTVQIVGTANEGDSLTEAGVGTWTINGITGVMTFTPFPDYFGPVTDIQYTVKDNDGLVSAPATRSLNVNPINDAPVTGSPTAQTTNEDVALNNINVLSAASDVDGDTLTVQAGSASATNGAVSINGDGTLNYTPNANYFGSDTISYSVGDGKGGSSSGSVAVTVNSVNDAPTALAGLGGGSDEDNGHAYSVVGFGSDIDGTIDPATVQLVGTANAGDSLAEAGVGVWTVNSTTGAITFTPEPDYDGPVTPVGYFFRDDQGLQSNNGTVTHNINPINDAPVTGSPIAQTTNEDVVLNNINVLSAASDVDGDTLTVLAGSASALNGAVTINGDGTLNYTPNAGYNGSDTISYTVDDGNGGMVGGTVAMTVSASTNNAPVAGFPAGQTTSEDTTLSNIDVLSFASDVDGDTVSIVPGSTTATNGTVSINGDGTLNYTPNADYFGSDIISYTVTDGNGGTANSTFSMLISSVNDAPVTTGESLGPIAEDSWSQIAVLSNDTDIDGTFDLTTLQIVGTASAGDSLTVAGEGLWSINAGTSVIRFVPEANYSGAVTPIQYIISDNDGAVSNPATVNYTILPVNDAPFAGFQNSYVTAEDTAINNIDVLASAFDVDGDTLTVLAGSASATNGTVTINGDGTLNYTPNADYFGADTIVYTVDDGNGGTVVGSVPVSVNPVNDAPVASSTSINLNEDASITIVLGGFITDVDGSVFMSTLKIVGTANAGDTLIVAGQGSWHVNLGAGSIQFIPEPDYDGAVTPIQFTVEDNGGLESNPGTITYTINPVNDAPISGTPTAVTTNINVSANNIDVLSSASDVDGDTLTVLAGSASATNGSVTINGDGSLNYTPNTGYTGADSISYTVDDGNGGTVVGTVAVTVSAVNNAPSLDLNNNDGGIGYGTGYLENSGLRQIVDPSVVVLDDGDAIAGIQIELNGFTDGASENIWINGTSFPYTSNATTTAVFSTFTMDVNYDNAISMITLVLQGGGTLTASQAEEVLLNTMYEHTSDNPSPGDRNFSVTITDDAGQDSAVALSTLTVFPQNDAPVAGSPAGLTTPLNTALSSVDVLSVASDVDGDTLSIQAGSTSALHGAVIINGDGTLNYSPTTGYVGSDTISYTVSDGNGGTVVGTVSVTVGAGNIAPTASNASATANEDAGASYNINLIANDVDGTIDIATIQIVGTANEGDSYTEPGVGTWVVHNNGVIHFQPLPDFDGVVAPIQYTVKDNEGLVSNTATITHTITPVNDAPAVNNNSSTGIEDTGVTYIALAFANDADGSVDPTTVQIVGTANEGDSHTEAGVGTWSVNGANGDILFTPVADYDGVVAPIQFTVKDNDGLVSSPATITHTITPVNDAPVAVNNLAGTSEDVWLEQHVLSNDSDVDGTLDPATVKIVGTVNAGDSLTVAGEGVWSVDLGTGAIRFTPEANYDGVVTPIQYTVRDDGGLESNAATLTHTITPMNDGPMEIVAAGQNGTGLNLDGGNASYYQVNDAGAVMGGLTAFTAEIQFAVQDTTGVNFIPLFNYNNGPDLLEVSLDDITTSPMIGLEIDGISFSSSYDPSALLDGSFHTVSLTWDNTAGDWGLYVDGALVESGTGLATSSILPSDGEMVFGQDQDDPGGSFSELQVFKGTYFDARIFNDVRTAGEIAAGAGATVASNESGLVANWVFGAGGSDDIIDTVSGNNLTLNQVSGLPWTSSTPAAQIGVRDDAADGSVVADLTTLDPDTGDTFIYAITSDVSGFFDVSGDQIVLAAGANLDNNTASTHSITVEVTDSGGLTHSQLINISVIEAPASSSPISNIGTPNTDQILGTSNDEYLYAQGSNDSVYGYGGNDSLHGQDGTDTLYGGTGDDELYGDRVFVAADTVSAQLAINTTTVGNQSPPVTVALDDGSILVIWYDDAQADPAGQVRGQILHHDGTNIGAELLIGSAGVEGVFITEMPPLTAVSLANGNVLVSWASDNQLNIDGSDEAVVGAIVDTSLNTVGPQFIINTTTTGHQSAPVIIALDDGRAVAFWYDNAWADDGTMVVRSQFIASDGTLLGLETTVGTSAVEGRNLRDSPPLAATKLSDGNVYVSWATNNILIHDGSGSAVVGVLINTVSNTTGSENIVNTTTFSNQSSPILVPLSDGGVVVIWYDHAELNSPSQTFLHGQYLNADGTQQGSEFSIGVSNVMLAGIIGQPSMTAIELADGNVLVGWQSYDVLSVDGAGSAVLGTIVNSASQTAGTEFVINTTTVGDQSAPIFTSLHDGRVFATWFGGSGSDDDGQRQVFGQFLNSDGTNDGSELLLGHDTVEGNNAIDMPLLTAVVTANGDIFVGWGGNDTSSGDGDGGAVIGVLVSTQSTVSTDYLYGGAGNDALYGGGGDDRLDGGAGADVLDGGSGIDRVSYANATAGVDALFGDTQNFGVDGLYINTTAGGKTGEAAGDSYSSIEAVIGSAFDDRIFGAATGMIVDLGAGDDVFDVVGSTSTADSIKGGDGNDRINAGAGGDLLLGGAGNDYLAGEDGDDQIFGEDGDDTLVGGTGADVLDGGAGTDTVRYANATAGVDALFSATDGAGIDGVYLNTAAGGQTGDAAGDTYTSVEAVIGSQFSDRIYGADAGMNADLGAGDDVYDVSSLNSGIDIVNGGTGSDEVYTAGGDDILNGGAGDDRLYGEEGNDTINGDEGDDTLDGGEGDDTLNGGIGTDIVIMWGNQADYTVMDNGDGTFTSTYIGSGADHGTDILSNVEFLQFWDGTVTLSSVAVASPIAFDLNGDGEINVTGATSAQDKSPIAELGSTVQFDMDGDGDLETIEWVDGSGDALLVDNRDGNAATDMNGTRLFGDQGGTFEHGYEQLAALDSDGSGTISGEETEGLNLWVDDGDALVEEGELFTLEEMGVSEIQLELVENATDDQGRDLFRSSATMRDGSQVMTEDVWFAQDDMSQDERYIQPEPVEPERAILEELS